MKQCTVSIVQMSVMNDYNAFAIFHCSINDRDDKCSSLMMQRRNNYVTRIQSFREIDVCVWTLLYNFNIISDKLQSLLNRVSSNDTVESLSSFY